MSQRVGWLDSRVEPMAQGLRRKKGMERSFLVTREKVALTTKTHDLVEVFERIYGGEGADDDLPWGETFWVASWMGEIMLSVCTYGVSCSTVSTTRSVVRQGFHRRVSRPRRRGRERPGAELAGLWMEWGERHT